ncbi:hypothetical protein DDK22_35825 [Cupriavidus necator]|uniref:Uncharacterized protein n=1 Tax=Cupriavidus necator TaxID=106590 RepID=A0A367P798_CUPNE|nr:hypothetical protein DDK22_35825 [Cupriavidus necator]
MQINQRSLRFLVEKWFDSSSFSSLRITRVLHSTLGRNHCVRVELPRTDNPVAVFFFRHDDGSWSVFPPETKRRSMTPAC